MEERWRGNVKHRSSNSSTRVDETAESDSPAIFDIPKLAVAINLTILKAMVAGIQVFQHSSYLPDYLIPVSIKKIYSLLHHYFLLFHKLYPSHYPSRGRQSSLFFYTHDIVPSVLCHRSFPCVRSSKLPLPQRISRLILGFRVICHNEPIHYCPLNSLKTRKNIGFPAS
jgi:hypothetical protein